MSRPRKPYANPPGRIPGTMIKVLAAELSDQGRLSRGKRYWADNAVTDIVIGHGVVTAEIQGSRPQPYIVTLFTTAGNGVPGKRDLRIRCTCPDDGLFDACKHAVAAMFALSDEIAIEPELIERWRGGTAAVRSDEQLADVIPFRRPVRQPEPDPDDLPSEQQVPEPVARPVEPIDPTVEQIARMLVSPSGANAPELPEVAPISHAGLRDRQLAEVLASALDHLEISWQ